MSYLKILFDPNPQFGSAPGYKTFSKLYRLPVRLSSLTAKICHYSCVSYDSYIVLKSQPYCTFIVYSFKKLLKF